MYIQRKRDKTYDKSKKNVRNSTPKQQKQERNFKEDQKD